MPSARNRRRAMREARRDSSGAVCRQLHTRRLDSGGAARQPARRRRQRSQGGIMRRVGLVAGAVALALSCAGPAFAQSLPTVVDGKTAMVSDYDQAIRERVYIPNGLDADRDGVEDRTRDRDHAPEGIRAGHEGPGDRRAEPVLHVGLRAVRRRVHRRPRRRRRSTTAGRSGTTTTSCPRGYAVILAEMGGTANSTGCATNGGREDVLSHQGRDRLAQRPPARATAPRPAPPTRCSPPGTPARRR